MKHKYHALRKQCMWQTSSSNWQITTMFAALSAIILIKIALIFIYLLIFHGVISSDITLYFTGERDFLGLKLEFHTVMWFSEHWTITRVWINKCKYKYILWLNSKNVMSVIIRCQGGARLVDPSFLFKKLRSFTLVA